MNKGPKRHRPRYNRDGLPVAANDWLEEDWADLHFAIEEIKRRVAARHDAQRKTDNPNPNVKA